MRGSDEATTRASARLKVVRLNVTDKQDLLLALGADWQQTQGATGELVRHNGAEIWGGHKQAVKPCQGGLQLNLDAAATAFLTAGPLLDLLAGALGMRDRGALAREQPNPRMQRALKVVIHLLTPGMAVLELCASAHSHMPAGLALAEHVGQGMNGSELTANAALSCWFVQVSAVPPARACV